MQALNPINHSKLLSQVMATVSRGRNTTIRFLYGLKQYDLVPPYESSFLYIDLLYNIPQHKVLASGEPLYLLQGFRLLEEVASAQHAPDQQV